MTEKPEDFTPYKNRAEHEYLNKMTVLIVKCRNIIKNAEEAVTEIRETTEKYFDHSTNIKRKEDHDKEI